MTNSFIYNFQYSLYGRRVLSDIELPELAPASEDDCGEFLVRRGNVSSDISALAEELGPFLRADTNMLNLQIPGVVAMAALDGRELIYEPADGIDENSIRVFLFGSGIAALLKQAGTLVLHGNAINLDSGCILCVGHSGSGKSTISVGMLQRGHSIIADDVCPIDNDGYVIPGMPRIKLWQDSADLLGVDTQGLVRVRPGLEKFSLPLNDAYCSTKRRIKAVIVLATHNLPELTKETVRGEEKFMELRKNTFRLRFVKGLKLQTKHFKQITKLGSSTPVFRITRPTIGNSLPQILDMIEQIGSDDDSDA